MILQSCSECGTEYFTDDEYKNSGCPRDSCSGELEQ